MRRAATEGHTAQKYLELHTRSNPCGRCRPASSHTVRGVSEKGPAINQGPHQTQNYASIKEVWILVLGLFTFLSAVSQGSLQYQTLEMDWERTFGLLVRNLRAMRVVYRVNVSESSGASSPKLPQIKGHYTDVVVTFHLLLATQRKCLYFVSGWLTRLDQGWLTHLDQGC